jgi:hypothetical protein
MPDNSQTDVASQILSAALDGGKVRLVWSDSIHQELHSTCLRHSPGFPGGERPAGVEGRFPSSCEGLVPDRAELTADGDLRLCWQPGGLQSQHSNEWLQAQLDLLQARGQSPSGQIIWDATRIADLPKPAFTAVIADEEARLELFEQVLNWGVTLIREVPAQPGTVKTVASWFGQIQPNPDADDPARPLMSSIRVDAAQPVATRMSHFLGPHTDTCWRQSLIGLLLMHCLPAHPEGGRSMLVPGDLSVIDNQRVLHGREAFDAAAGERHIQCCNVERDDFHNHYRRLAKRLGVDDWGKRLSAGVI